MTPSQLSTQLRHLAAKISNSKSPRRDLVSFDLKRILAAVEECKWCDGNDYWENYHTNNYMNPPPPEKPSDLVKVYIRPQSHNDDRGYMWVYSTYYLVYKDSDSIEWPYVVIFNDALNVNPSHNTSPLLILSFADETELKSWEDGELPTPDNAEIIDPEDADKLMSSVQLISWGEFK